jgi:hypothetical protein
VIGRYLVGALWLLSVVAASAIVYGCSNPGAPTPRPGMWKRGPCRPDPLGDEQTKVCPDCAESVKAAARVCRFCRYEFDKPSVRDAD